MNKIFALIIFAILASRVGATEICEANTVQLAKNFELLKGVDRLNNCKIEVVTQVKDNIRQYALYAHDLFLCSINKEHCSDSLFALDLPASCDVKADQFAAVRSSTEFKDSQGDFVTFIEFKVSRENQPMQMRLGESELSSQKRISYINCNANPTDGENR